MKPLTYLQQQCRLRRNVLTGQLLYANSHCETWLPLSKEGRNTILLMAQDKDVALTAETRPGHRLRVLRR